MTSIRKSRIFLVVFILLAIAISIFYVNLYFSIRDKNQYFSLISSEINKASLDEEKINALENILESTEADSVKLNSYFTDSDGIVSLLDYIENLTDYTGVEIEIGSVDFVDSDNDTKVLVINIDTEGSFRDIYQLLILLENGVPEFDFRSVYLDSIDSDAVSAKQSVWRGTFSLELISFLNS